MRSRSVDAGAGGKYSSQSSFDVVTAAQALLDVLMAITLAGQFLCCARRSMVLFLEVPTPLYVEWWLFLGVGRPWRTLLLLKYVSQNWLGNLLASIACGWCSTVRRQAMPRCWTSF